ncbi:MAG: InlB B-repeat-containing protein [Treponematales bacterium]
MEKFGGKVQTAALAALLAMGALGLGGCGDAWRILTTGDLYWDDNGKKVYAFRYDPSGGELYGGTPEGDIAEGTTVTLPSSGVRERYTLTGFTLSGAAEGGFNPGDTFTMPAGEVTAAANWTVNTYALSYEANGGALSGGTPAGSIAEGTTVTLPSSGSRERYTLTGFTLSGALTGTKTPGAAFTMPAGAVTATAEWTPVVVTIGSGRFIMAGRVENICFVERWSGAEVDYGDTTREKFHYYFDAERVLDFTKWDQEAQRLLSWHIIDPLEYDETAGGVYIAVRRFTDTGEMAEY